MAPIKDAASTKPPAKSINIGGQAVIDGVMMRAPGRVATAVRIAPDRILVHSEEFHSLSRRIPFFRLPVLRGALSLFESLVIGTRTLNWSAEISQHGMQREAEHGFGQRVLTGLSLLLALGVGLLLFMYLPYLASSALDHGNNQVYFHLVVGVVRILLLLGYLWGISQWSDVRVLFAYHGAEHKSIYAWEETRHVTVAEARLHTRFHPRCGTSFLLVVALSTVLVYAVFDTMWIRYFDNYSSILHRLLVHLPIIPLVAGFSFELLQLSNKFRGHGLARLLIAPGLWFQRLTTQEPDEHQLEVAVVAIRASLQLPMDGLDSQIDFI